MDNMTACLYIFLLQFRYDLRMLQNPAFRADSRRHPSFDQIGACGAVQTDNFSLHKRPKFFFVICYPFRLSSMYDSTFFVYTG